MATILVSEIQFSKIPLHKNRMKGKLVIISGPSGCGKTTVCAQLTQSPNIKKSVSVTTRPPRSYEVDGKHYHFISRDAFYKKIDEGRFAEYAEYSGNLYGTLLDPLTKALENGFTYILEIDVHGALQILNKFPDAVTVFLLPPDRETLEKRLINRGSNKKDEVSERLEIAKDECEYRHNFKYCIVNDKLEDTVEEIRKVLELN